MSREDAPQYLFPILDFSDVYLNTIIITIIYLFFLVKIKSMGTKITAAKETGILDYWGSCDGNPDFTR